MARTRSAVQQLAALLGSGGFPIYALDEQRRLVYCNPACAEWLGIPAEQLLGTRCDYSSAGTAPPEADAATALCPPPEVFHGQRCSGRIYHGHDATGATSRRAEYLPIGLNATECRGVLVIVASTEDREAPSARASGLVQIDSDVLHQRLQQLKQELRGYYRLDRLAGDSYAMRRVRQQVQLALTSRTHVLITGPLGSGREQIGRTIHSGADPQAAGPLLPLSCPVLDADLVQTTILAFLKRCAETHQAEQPTLLLLDIDQLVVEGQAELLAFFRIPTFHARAIVTAQQPLIALAEQQLFSRDLAYQLSPLVIELPALAERREDIPLVLQQLVEEHNLRGGQQFSGFAPDAVDALATLPWKGNLDELVPLVQEACINAAGPWILLSDLPPRVRFVSAAAAHPPRSDETIVLDEFLAEVERELVERAMRRAKGNKAHAARLLGIPRTRLLRKLTQLGLEQPGPIFRPSD